MSQAPSLAGRHPNEPEICRDRTRNSSPGILALMDSSARLAFSASAPFARGYHRASLACWAGEAPAPALRDPQRLRRVAWMPPARHIGDLLGLWGIPRPRPIHPCRLNGASTCAGTAARPPKIAE